MSVKLTIISLLLCNLYENCFYRDLFESLTGRQFGSDQGNLCYLRQCSLLFKATKVERMTQPPYSVAYLSWPSPAAPPEGEAYST